jgi:hypothetical protein
MYQLYSGLNAGACAVFVLLEIGRDPAVRQAERFADGRFEAVIFVRERKTG